MRWVVVISDSVISDAVNNFCPILPLSLSLHVQLRCGQWHIIRSQPAGPDGQPGLRPHPAGQFCPQPTERVLPLPLWQRLRPLPQVYVQKLLHRQWHVSAPCPLIVPETFFRNYFGCPCRAECVCCASENLCHSWMFIRAGPKAAAPVAFGASGKCAWPTADSEVSHLFLAMSHIINKVVKVSSLQVTLIISQLVLYASWMYIGRERNPSCDLYNNSSPLPFNSRRGD